MLYIWSEHPRSRGDNYLFLTRSLDDTLKGLEYPEVADPVGFVQAQKAFRRAMWVKDLDSLAEREKAKRKLQGVLNRLVVQPARDTVGLGVLQAGTAYARVAEPGACAFCLMLAARGEVYSDSTVFGDTGRYHDNCRCLAIEVKNKSQLPRLNRDLADLWEETRQGHGGTLEFKDWRHTITAMREQYGGDTDWPKLKYARIPTYRYGGKSVVFEGEEITPFEENAGACATWVA
ncbi:VG15 protein [Corynebacterium kutscheri]|nr:hypothetical protein [Corynebacterium kutscheri]